MDAQPPIVFVDESGEVGHLFASVDDLIGYLEWPQQFDAPAQAYDARGRHIILTSATTRGPVVVTVSPREEPDRPEELLRSIVRERPVRYGVLDAELSLDVLLRLLWPHMRWGKGAYPGDIDPR